MAIPPVFDNEVARGEILHPKNISEIESVPSRHSVLPDGRSVAHEAAQQRMLSGCPLCPHSGWAEGPAHVGSILLQRGQTRTHQILLPAIACPTECRRPSRDQWGRSRHSQWLEMEGCVCGPWSTQNAIQSLHALVTDRRVLVFATDFGPAADLRDSA